MQKTLRNSILAERGKISVNEGNKSVNGDLQKLSSLLNFYVKLFY